MWSLRNTYGQKTKFEIKKMEKIIYKKYQHGKNMVFDKLKSHKN